MIRQPPILQGTEAQQIRQLRSYLYQLSRELEATLQTIGTEAAQTKRILAGEAESGLQRQMQDGLRDLQGLVHQSAADVADVTAADVITETGTVGDWDYVYYQSGRKEAWYDARHSQVAFTAYGNIYRSPAIVIDLPPTPNDSITMDYIEADGYGASQTIWFAQVMYGNVSYPDNITTRACSAVEITQNIRVRIHVCYH